MPDPASATGGFVLIGEEWAIAVEPEPRVANARRKVQT
jgi:hypothetical protein